MPDIPPATADTVLPVPAAAAFDLFTTRFSGWWPPEFSWSGEDLIEDIGIEPRLGGFLYERGPLGFRLDWGRVTEWDPGRRLAFTWQISPQRVPEPDASKASEVTVRFEPADDGASTRVVVDHHGWERHGDGAADYREQFGGAWPYALDRLTDLARSST